MTIGTDLRLSLPIRFDDNGEPSAYAYHTAISMPTFETNYRILAATKAALFAQGPRYAFEVGAQIAALALRDAGKQDALYRGDVDASGSPKDGGADALLSEMRRLTQVAAPGASGWEQVPVDIAKQRGAIDDDDIRDMESALVFFTCVLFLTPRTQRKAAAGIAASLARGSIVSSSITEWIASLPKQTPATPSIKAA